MTDTNNDLPPVPQGADATSASEKRPTLTLKGKRHRADAGQGKATAAPNPAEPATSTVKPKANDKPKAEVEPSPYRAYVPRDVLKDAQRLFPGVFDLAAPPGPLAVGALVHYFPGLVELGWSKKSVRRFLGWYVERTCYDRVAMTADYRLAPDGAQGEAMTDVQRRYHTSRYQAEKKAIRDRRKSNKQDNEIDS